MPIYKICLLDRKRKCMVKADTIDELILSSCKKFSISMEETQPRLVLEEDGTEVDDSDILLELPPTIQLMLLLDEEMWSSAKPIGGGSINISKLSPLQHRILALIPGTAESMDNQFDNDAKYSSLTKTAASTSSTSAMQPGENTSSTTSRFTHVDAVPIAIEYIDVTSDYEKTSSPKVIHSVSENAVPSTSTADSPSNTQTLASKFMPVKRSWASRRRPVAQTPPVAEVTLRFDKLAEAKLELVHLQIELLKKGEERKEEQEKESCEFQRLEHEQQLEQKKDEYMMKKKTFLEEHVMKMEILKTELELKKYSLQKEKMSGKQ